MGDDTPHTFSVVPRGLGVGRVEACAEDITVMGDSATTFGIALLSVDVCYGDVVSSLLWLWAGIWPKGLACISIFQNNNNINICLKPQTHNMKV